jgi:hypothetical protein
MWNKIRCLFGYPRWARRVNDTGQHYRECSRCGKYGEYTTTGGAAPFG